MAYLQFPYESDPFEDEEDVFFEEEQEPDEMQLWRGDKQRRRPIGRPKRHTGCNGSVASRSHRDLNNSAAKRTRLRARQLDQDIADAL